MYYWLITYMKKFNDAYSDWYTILAEGIIKEDAIFQVVENCKKVNAIPIIINIDEIDPDHAVKLREVYDYWFFDEPTDNRN